MGSPAYAGKRISKKSKRSVLEDHPRLCGEKMRRSFEKGYDKGSPPPMRGKGPPVADMWKRSGITPAYAGKSDRDFVAVHKFIGSPPPMRGKETPA